MRIIWRCPRSDFNIRLQVEEEPVFEDDTEDDEDETDEVAADDDDEAEVDTEDKVSDVCPY